MSYDLMVFEKSTAPRTRKEFLQWYKKQTEWTEDHSYDDPVVCSEALRKWYMDIIKRFPPINGPYTSDDVDDPKVTDYAVGKEVIYAAFAWSAANEVFKTTFELAKKHTVGFFDVSSLKGSIMFPNESGELIKIEKLNQKKDKKPWWKIW